MESGAAAASGVRPAPNVFYVPPLSPHRLNDDGSIDYRALQELSVAGSFGSHPHDLEEIFRLEAEHVIDIEASVSYRLALGADRRGTRDAVRTKRGDPQRIVVEL